MKFNNETTYHLFRANSFPVATLLKTRFIMSVELIRIIWRKNKLRLARQTENCDNWIIIEFDNNLIIAFKCKLFTGCPVVS